RPYGTVLIGLVGLRHRLGIDELLVLVAALPVVGRDEVVVGGLVGEIEEVGRALLLLAEPFERVIGELAGDVALLRHALAVDVQAVLIGEVGALAAEADP